MLPFRQANRALLIPYPFLCRPICEDGFFEALIVLVRRNRYGAEKLPGRPGWRDQPGQFLFPAAVPLERSDDPGARFV